MMNKDVYVSSIFKLCLIQPAPYMLLRNAICHSAVIPNPINMRTNSRKRCSGAPTCPAPRLPKFAKVLSKKCSSAMAERPRELGDFKKTRVNGGTDSHSLRPYRSRSAAAYNHQTFPWTICRSVHAVRTYVRRSIGLSSALWQNGGSDLGAVWHHRSDGSRDEAGSGVWGSVHSVWKGYFWGRIWDTPL